MTCSKNRWWERSLGRNKLQGRCLWVSEPRKKENARGDLTSLEERKEEWVGGGWMLPRRTTSVISVSLSVESQVHHQTGTIRISQQNRHFCYLAVWHNTLSFFIQVGFSSLLNEAQSLCFNWDIRALICHICVWIISRGIVLLRKNKVDVQVLY